MQLRRLAKKITRPILITLNTIGINPRKLVLLRFFPKYLSHYKIWRNLGGQISHRVPILSDWSEQAGSSSGHYFHQDLIVASFVFTNKPNRHIDIGSRIDGFVAHVASFRKIEVLDIRPLESTGHDNISFLQMNLMDAGNVKEQIADSISCLHAIEHFGLGRYGDPIDPSGHINGFNNLLRMLKPNGVLYISFPIGLRNEVHFNAHRVFHPQDIFTWAHNENKIELVRFDYVDDAGDLHKNLDIHSINPNLTLGCGIYTFIKRTEFNDKL